MNIPESTISSRFLRVLPMREMGIDRTPQHLAPSGSELRSSVRKLNDFGGAHEGEIQRIEKQQQIFVLVVVEADLLESLGGGIPCLALEEGCDLAHGSSDDVRGHKIYVIQLRQQMNRNINYLRSQISNLNMKNKSKPNIDMDLYSTSIVDDLLMSNSEWHNVDDIVKLTIKALTDVVKVQSESLKQIKNTLPTRASKTQLTTGLSLKANISDVSRTITDISNSLETKISLNEFQSALKDYIPRYQFQQIIVNKANIDDLKNLVSHKAEKNDKLVEGAIFQAKFDQFYKEVHKRFANCVSIHEFQEVLTIIEQKANITEINEALEAKASKAVMNTALQKKISKSDLELYLSKKADIGDLEYIVNNLETKVDLSTIEKLTQVIENKCDKSDLNILVNSLGEKMEKSEIQIVLQAMDELRLKVQKSILEVEHKVIELNKDQLPKKKIESLSETISKLQENLVAKLNANDLQPALQNLKYDIMEEMNRIRQQTKQSVEDIGIRIKENYDNREMVVKELTTELHLWKRKEDKLYEEIDEVRRRAEEISGSCIDKKEFIEFKSKIEINLDEKLQSQEVQEAFNKWESALHDKILYEKEETTSVIRNFEKTFSNNISATSAEIMHITTILNKKMDKHEYAGLEDMIKRNRKEIDECRKTVDKSYGEIQNKLNLNEYEHDLIEIKKKIEAVAKQLHAKANIKDVCVLVDSKPNIEEVNKALAELRDFVESKVTKEEHQNFVQEQGAINETLCSENIVGRWLWNSGQVKTGSLIPWESESVNTLTDNFLWDKDKTSILTLSAGYYEISVCVFGKPKSIISLLVNGDVAITRTSTVDEKQPGSTLKRKKQKDLVGFTLREFIQLPQRARVSVCYNGQYGAEGFLNIRRL